MGPQPDVEIMAPKVAEAAPEETEAEQQARVFAKLQEMGSGTKTEDEESRQTMLIRNRHNVVERQAPPHDVRTRRSRFSRLMTENSRVRRLSGVSITFSVC